MLNSFRRISDTIWVQKQKKKVSKKRKEIGKRPTQKKKRRSINDQKKKKNISHIERVQIPVNTEKREIKKKKQKRSAEDKAQATREKKNQHYRRGKNVGIALYCI